MSSAIFVREAEGSTFNGGLHGMEGSGEAGNLSDSETPDHGGADDFPQQLLLGCQRDERRVPRAMKSKE